MDDFLPLLHLVNAGLGIGVIMAASVVYTYFERTSIAAPLQWLGFAIVFFVLHSVAAAYEMFVGETLSPFFSAHDLMISIFLILMIAGLYKFKKGFETFDWASQAAK